MGLHWLSSGKKEITAISSAVRENYDESDSRSLLADCENGGAEKCLSGKKGRER